MEKLERYLRFIREAERLKDVLRTAHTSTGRHESTAEHSWRLALLAAVLTGERPRLDMQRVLLMCLVHDLGEAYDGDIPAVAQMADGTKEAAELAAMDKLTRMLPPAAGTAIRKIWEEYEACQTPEARWVKALDKAETARTDAEPDLRLRLFPRRRPAARPAPPAGRRDPTAHRPLSRCGMQYGRDTQAKPGTRDVRNP